jgi:glucose/arabinose dehydrogenase
MATMQELKRETMRAENQAYFKETGKEKCKACLRNLWGQKHISKEILLMFSAVLLLTACSSTQKVAPSTDSSGLAGITTQDWNVKVLSDKLNYPWEVRVSEGVLIVTEASGTIAMIDTNGILKRYQVKTSNRVVHNGGSGLMGLALPGDFADRGTAYIYYTYNPGSGLTNRVAEVNFDGTSWNEKRILLDGIPGHQLYNGGRLAIGPDGYLYAATGWIHDNDLPQDLKSLAGKILRMNLDGQPAAGNPFASSYVYSYGHRNPQGLAWDTQGQLYASEHGESGHDEINIVTAGGNYGWPIVQGDSRQDGMLSPYIHSGNRAWAPSGIAFADGQLVVAALAAQTLYVKKNETKILEPIFTSGERMRSVQPYQNGMYIITTNTSPRATSSSGVADRLLSIQPKDAP